MKFIVNAVRFKNDKLFLENSFDSSKVFSDISKQHSFFEFINVAYYETKDNPDTKKVIKGFSNGEFRPNLNVTREATAKILTNSKKYAEIQLINCNEWFCQDLYSENTKPLARQMNKELLLLINNHRANNKLKPLIMDSVLNDVAYSHSAWMNKTSEFSHIGEDGTDPFQRCENFKTECEAENIAFALNQGPSKYFELWKSSPGHNANMLNSDYTKIGIGIKNGYATTVFSQ